MGNWKIRRNVISRFGGGPFANSTQEYRWNGENWRYYSRSEDRAPGMMVPVCESDINEFEHDIEKTEAFELLGIYGLTENDVPLNVVACTSPQKLEELASTKK